MVVSRLVSITKRQVSSRETWKALDFRATPDGVPHAYSFSFESTGEGFVGRARGDLDGDGVLETGPSGDDECTPAHNCAGSGPDIGPFEYGL